MTSERPRAPNAQPSALLGESSLLFSTVTRPNNRLHGAPTLPQRRRSPPAPPHVLFDSGCLRDCHLKPSWDYSCLGHQVCEWPRSLQLQHNLWKCLCMFLFLCPSSEPVRPFSHPFLAMCFSRSLKGDICADPPLQAPHEACANATSG